VTSAAERWSRDLASWAIPAEILDSAPESPWIHPVKMFTVTGKVTDSLSHERAREALPTKGSLLDVGCGGGRATLALIPPAADVTGVDEEQAMLDSFSKAVVDSGVVHREVLGRWPNVESQAPFADVVVCHHVLYNVADLVPFIRALDAHARQRVVIEIPTTHPLTHMAPLWREFWALERPNGPTADDACDVIRSAGIEANMDIWVDEEFSARALLTAEEQARYMRIRLCLPPERESDVAAFLAAAPAPAPRHTATIWWDVLDR